MLEECEFLQMTLKCLTSLSPLFTVIRAKVVGKKMLQDGPFGTMRYTVKQMKVSSRQRRIVTRPGCE